MATNDTLRGNLESINLDYRTLGHGGPGGVHLHPATEGKGCEEEGTETPFQQLLAHLVLVLITKGPCLRVYIFLGRDENHLTRQGKSIFPSRMTDKVRRALI